MEAFWTFLHCGWWFRRDDELMICYLRSRSAHLRSIGRLSVVPSIFTINEPVIFGTPIVMNPVSFYPLPAGSDGECGTGVGGDETGFNWAGNFSGSLDGPGSGLAPHGR